MDSRSIRSTFIEFFKERAHQIVPSAPLVLKDDPTLMFTNAGMNQFKDFFLGHQEIKNPRIADTQKCLRVSGKHNDLEQVGMDTYHHTMFEMLGNWSFGDYFKSEAIHWAWELLTREYQLPAERLYATVFGGDLDENLTWDEEAFNIWRTMLSEEKILKGSKKDNFWEMGDSGPCGPCSEIHIDLRPQDEIDRIPGSDLINQDHPLVMEIWNLVFIQFNRKTSGSLESLPQKHVDTGMGFERLVMAVQNKTSNYDTDLFKPLIDSISNRSGIVYGQNEKTDIAIRVIVDHIRAISFAIADGQLPSNTKAGYVVRRILRRAVRYGYTFLGMKEPFLFSLVEVLAEQFKQAFPEINQQREFIQQVITEEESSFLRTLENGLKKLDAIQNDKKTIDGKIAFELYDTYGFPFDLTSLIARDKGLSVDLKGFESEMQRQKHRSRQAAEVQTEEWVVVIPGDSVEFVGHKELETISSILRFRRVNEKKGGFYQLVLDRTPFYAESGGQVGDTGVLISGEEKIPISDTRKENNLILHFSSKLPKDPKKPVTAKVEADRRLSIQNNHSATHLMHAALRLVLGNHVHQKGSLVNDKLLRFDFSHYAKLTSEEINKVEHLVNQKIRENIAGDIQSDVPLAQAKEMGAIALFGEKYGEFVRVVTFDQTYSIELCGGTHVPLTGQIGQFRIISESSIAAGVRRIEALTALAAEQYLDAKLDLVNEINETLKHPKELSRAVGVLVEERSRLIKEVEGLREEKVKALRAQLKASAENRADMTVIIEPVNLNSPDDLKSLSFQLKKEFDQLFMVLAADINGKPQVGVVVSESLVKAKNMHAGEIVKELAKEINGGGGGQPFFATAGGRKLDGLKRVVERARDLANDLAIVRDQ